MDDLREMQAWSLERKIRVTQLRIDEFYNRYDGNAYVSFSGGKDSTVLLDLARRVYPEIPAVFCDTGLEYPEIRKFVKSHKNVEWLRPKMSFPDVIKKYGYPVISKEVSHDVAVVKNNANCKTALRFDSNSPHIQKYGKQFSKERWKFLIGSPFLISSRCCDVMKKSPSKSYEKRTRNHPIVGTMACESLQRRSNWFKSGCNAFENVRPMSQPMSFWTEQNVLEYLKLTGIPYCEVYGDIVEENGKLKTTGLDRTGCMFCMFGAHLEKEPNRFQRMKETHPKQYEYCMKPVEEGGLGLATVLDYIGVKYE